MGKRRAGVQQGCSLERLSPSIKHRTKRGKATVSGKPSDDIRPATFNSILKQAGLK